MQLCCDNKHLSRCHSWNDENNVIDFPWSLRQVTGSDPLQRPSAFLLSRMVAKGTNYTWLFRQRFLAHVERGNKRSYILKFPLFFSGCRVNMLIAPLQSHLRGHQRKGRRPAGCLQRWNQDIYGSKWMSVVRNVVIQFNWVFCSDSIRIVSQMIEKNLGKEFGKVKDPP